MGKIQVLTIRTTGAANIIKYTYLGTIDCNAIVEKQLANIREPTGVVTANVSITVTADAKRFNIFGRNSASNIINKGYVTSRRILAY